MHKIKHKLIRLLDSRFNSILRLLKKDAHEVVDFLHKTLKLSLVAIFMIVFVATFSNSRFASSDSANLLTNPGAESNSTTGWTTLLNGGNGMSTSFDSFVHSGTYSFQTSYGVDSLSQTVDLLANGYTQNQLDTQQPAITFSDWIGTRSDQAGQYYLTFRLLGNDGSTVIATSGNTFGNSGSLLSLSSNTAFFQQTHTFTNYGAGVRYVYFEFGGRDQSNWAGNYGTHFDDASITVADLDTTAPVVTETTAVSSLTNDNTPNYTFTTNEAGTISYGGSCSSITTSATVGANTITFATLSDGAYSNCTITVTDTAGNASTALSVMAFTVDTTAPVLTETSPIDTATTDITPDYTFTTTGAGTISYGGSCSSATTSATVGANTITFNALEIATYSNCTITVTDTAGNASTALAVRTFNVVPTGSSRHSGRFSEETNTPPPDTETPPLHPAAPDAPQDAEKDDLNEAQKTCSAAQKSSDDVKKTVDEAQKKSDDAKKSLNDALTTFITSKNLLANPDAENGTLKGWNLTKSLGNGWAAGWDGFAHSGKKAFETSYGWDVRNQSVSLLSNGVTADQLDTNPPDITFSEWIGTRADQGGQYYLKFSLLGSDNNPAKPLATYSFGSEQSPITLKANTTWFQKTYTFSNYSKGVRYIYFEDGGKDVSRWRGYYGTHFDDASVTMALVDAKTVEARDAESKLAANDLAQKTASWKALQDEAVQKCDTTDSTPQNVPDEVIPPIIPTPTPPVLSEPVTPLIPNIEPVAPPTPEAPLNPTIPEIAPAEPATPSVPGGSSRHSEPVSEKVSIGPGSLHAKTFSSDFTAPSSTDPQSATSPALTSDSPITSAASGSGGGGTLSPRNSLGLRPPTEALPEEGVLGPGSTGPGVKILYQFLANNGFKIGKKSDAFDASLQKALIQFQVKYTDRGILGMSAMHFLNNLLRHPPVGICNTSHFNLIPPERPFTRPLKLDDHGTDVRVLQKFLNANGFLLATSGAGAPGRETEDFVDRTRMALQNFNNVYGLLSEKGTVGARNRFFINNLLLNPPALGCPTVKTPTVCLPYLQKHIQYGRPNDPAQVNKLQDFLRTHEGATAVETDGQYNEITRQAVIAFQNKYHDEILAPWGSKSGTGYVFTTTVKKINALMCQK